jgi:trigger factor
VGENKLRLAGQPKIDFPEDRDEMEKVLEASGDLKFSLSFEILPSFELGAFDEIELERLVAEVPDADIQQGLDQLAERNRPYEGREEGAAAQSGDKLTIDFVGRLGDEEFEGGKGGDVDLVLGSDSFIPGFEAQLEGATAGEARKITVTFPADYQALNLAGKEATFDVAVKAVAAPAAVTIDDAFAKNFGLDSLEKLREAVRERVKADYDRASREKLKRALLDALDKKYAFELPQDMVEQEFGGIWKQVEAELASTGKTFADAGETEEEQRAEYRRIAERRVRLGLVVAEIGEKAGVKVGDDEVGRAVAERARQFPGQEKLFWDYYQKNPQALAEIRAPLYEEKVVDHIIGLAKVSDRTVSKEELFKPLDDQEKA